MVGTPKVANLFRTVGCVDQKHGTAHELVTGTRDDDEVKKLVDRFYKKVPQLRTDASVVGELHSILEELYDILVEPVLSNLSLTYLDPNAMLVFVPDKVRGDVLSMMHL